MNKPKISVIIVYNKENNLYDCVQSAMQQSFSNIEIICVNNGACDNSENIVKEIASKTDRIKLISMPLGVDNQTAKRAGVSIAIGDFIIFIDNNEIVQPDFIKNAYISAQKEEQVELKNNYLYRRSFIENDREIAFLTNDRIKAELAIYSDFIEEQKQKINEEFDRFNKNNVENIKNNTYEVTARFNSLEKLFYDMQSQINEKIHSIESSLYLSIDEKFQNVYNDIQKVYDYINASFEKNGEEIGKIKESIINCKNYADEISENKSTCVIDKVQEIKSEVSNKLKDFEKEIILRYVNLKRITDLQFDEIKERLNGG